MGFKNLIVASLAAAASAYPLLNPIQMMARAGPAYVTPYTMPL
jgi:hypothetical protein